MNNKRNLSPASNEMGKPGEKKSREDTFEYERSDEEKEHLVKTHEISAYKPYQKTLLNLY